MQKYLSFIVVILLLTSCSKQTGDIELEKSSFSKLVDFEKDKVSEIYTAFRNLSSFFP